MPEYMISGDASNANYSSTLVAESPFVKFCKRQQKRFSGAMAQLLWAALDFACRAGTFRPWGIYRLGELAAVIDLKITGPLVEARDKGAETNRRKILHDNGILSPESWSEEENIDRNLELSRGARVNPMTLPGGNPTDSAPRATESKQRLDLAAAILWEGYP